MIENIRRCSFFDNVLIMEKKINHTILLVFFTVFFLPVIVGAKLMQLENRDLEEITGNAGFSIALKNIQVFQVIDSFRYCASDNGFIVLDKIKVHDGNGGPYTLNYDFGTAITTSGIIHYDIGEPEVASVNDWSGNNPTAITRGMTGVAAANWDQNITYTVGSFIFGDLTSSYGAVDLGSLELGPVGLNSFDYYYSPPIYGSGIDWESDFQLNIDHATYAYQSSATDCERIIMTGFYMGELFSDFSGDDPSDPSTWKPNNNVDYGQFKIGDLFGDLSNNLASNPASFNVGECTTGSGNATYPGVGMIALSTPLIGSIRFEDVQFGDVDFGPGAIDGIHAHRLELRLIP